MTKAHAENGPSNNDGGCPVHEPELDNLARINAGLLSPQPGTLEADRHSYPSPPQRLHKGNVPTGGVGGGHLHAQPPVKTQNWR